MFRWLIAAVLAVSGGPALSEAVQQAGQGAVTRARDLGIPFDGTPGPHNSITDVEGVQVGYSTIIEGDTVRTGVTAILPRGKDTLQHPSFAGWFSLNGNGEMTGTTWISESGFLEGPVMITNTHSVGVVRDAVIKWRVAQGGPDTSGYWWSLPVVAETYDGFLNDINGFHVREEHAFEALDNAAEGAIAEGNVGGGTGMICFELKCGTGTASRVLPEANGGFTVGALVQANFGLRDQLTVAGIPVGRELKAPKVWDQETGSIIIVVATNAPLLPHQLDRIARRASLGLARTGSTSGNGSGDIFLAFSTANRDAASPNPPPAQMLSNDAMSPLFDATVEAVEEAIINALVAGRTMPGANGIVHGIDHEELRAALIRHNRLAD